MNLIISPRQTGRTTKAILWVLEDPTNRYLVVHNRKEKDRIKRDYNVLDDCIMTYDELLNKDNARHKFTHFNNRMNNLSQTETIIDNAELFFSRIIPQPYTIYSLIFKAEK